MDRVGRREAALYYVVIVCKHIENCLKPAQPRLGGTYRQNEGPEEECGARALEGQRQHPYCLAPVSKRYCTPLLQRPVTGTTLRNA